VVLVEFDCEPKTEHHRHQGADHHEQSAHARNACELDDLARPLRLPRRHGHDRKQRDRSHQDERAYDVQNEKDVVEAHR
jgi:hypothetical protein